MLEYIELTNVGPAPHMRLDFAPRLNILTGDNGLGKTFTLETVWWAITGAWAGEMALPQRPKQGRVSWGAGQHSGWGEFDTAPERWSRDVGNAAVEALCLYARCNGTYAVRDPLREPPSESRDAITREPLTDFRFSYGSVWNGLRSPLEIGEFLAEGLIRDWVAWQEVPRKQGFFGALGDVIRKLSAGLEWSMEPAVPRRILKTEPRDIPHVHLPYGDVPVVHLSAGMKRILELAYLLVWSWNEHKLASELENGRRPADTLILLIDEVEAHLHPQWQRRLLPAVLEAVKVIQEDMQVQIIATTHEPLVLASLEPIWDEEQDALFHFRLDETGQVKVEREAWRRRGDVSAWLTSEVFGLQHPTSVPMQDAVERALALRREPDPSPDAIEAVHQELQGVLKDADPFWVRWLAFAEKHGVNP